MGLTINCARCHDHKIDPITQRDYYAMLAVFHEVNSYGGNSQRIIPDTNNQQLQLTWNKKFVMLKIKYWTYNISRHKSSLKTSVMIFMSDYQESAPR